MLRLEVTVQTTNRTLEHVADRIEQAYLRRRPEWRTASLDRRLWSSAATMLMTANSQDDWVPLDPELFVAAQLRAGLVSDPWMDLTRPRARLRYVARIKRIVAGLRKELRQEVRRAEAAVRRGDPLEVVLMSPSRSLTALSRYAVAIRHGRRDLADLFRDEGRAQHAACPLYRQASRDVIPEDDYPVGSMFPELSGSPTARSYSLN